MIEHITKSGKIIRVWDDFFPLDIRHYIFRQIMMAGFKLSLTSDPIITDQTSVLHLTCPINLADLMSMKFDISSIVGNKKFMNSWLNLNSAHERTQYHVDIAEPDCVSILYYANLKWDINWDGGTIWRSEDLKDIEFISDYVPGRLVMFDSTIPHKAIQPTYEAAPYRITLNTIWQ